jgi:T-complex protein 1 subunit zeta
MERIPLACGGYAVNSEKELKPDCLGHAGVVYEHTLGDDKFTFIEDVQNPYSCTILIRGPNKHTIDQIKDAVRDGLRAVKNALTDKFIIYGAGCFEAQASLNLMRYKKQIDGRKKLGCDAFAKALLAIPRTLADNAGLDQQDTLIKLMQATEQKKMVGIDLQTGDLLDPKQTGILDNYAVKKQFIHLGAIIACKLLLVDEIMRAGRSMGKKQ